MGWDAVWVKADEIIREGILISPNMANDHYAMTLQVRTRPECAEMLSERTSCTLWDQCQLLLCRLP